MASSSPVGSGSSRVSSRYLRVILDGVVVHEYGVGDPRRHPLQLLQVLIAVPDITAAEPVTANPVPFPAPKKRINNATIPKIN